MSKFASVIEAARKSEASIKAAPVTQLHMNTENHDHGKQGNRKTVNAEKGETVKMGSGERIITDTQEAVNTYSHEYVNAGTSEHIKTSNLTITIPTTHRHYWVGEARKRGTTITAIIVEALSAKLGKPDQ